MARLVCKQIESPIGPLVLAASEQGMASMEFGTMVDVENAMATWAAKRGYGSLQVGESDLLEEAAGQLADYFCGQLRQFRLPLDLRGTPFQKKVWEALTSIPFGQTLSYKQVAERIGSSGAVRAVGGANNRNPLPVIVPCHRVIGSDGQLVGYGGGLWIKQFLLQLEGVQVAVSV